MKYLLVVALLSHLSDGSFASSRKVANVVIVDRPLSEIRNGTNKRVRPHKKKNDESSTEVEKLKEFHPLSPFQPATGRAHDHARGKSSKSSWSSKSGKSTKTSKSSKYDSHYHHNHHHHHHRPTMSPAMIQPASSTSPSSLLTGDTVSPTSIPPGAKYYNSFEMGNFPEGDSRWSVETTTISASSNNNNDNNNSNNNNNNGGGGGGRKNHGGGRNNGRNKGNHGGTTTTTRGKRRRVLLEPITKKDVVSGKFRGRKCRRDQDDRTRNCRAERLRAKKEQQQQQQLQQKEQQQEEDPNKSSSDNQYWASTMEKSKTGMYSIRSPNVSNGSSRSATVTLATDKSWGEGMLVFHLLWDLTKTTDATTTTNTANLLWYVDDELIDSLESSSSSSSMGEWERFEISLDGEEEEHEVTWEYRYESSSEGGGVVYMDEVYFTEDTTEIPTPSPIFNIPTAPTTMPTTMQTYTPTYLPTGMDDTTSLPTTADATEIPTFPTVATAAPTTILPPPGETAAPTIPLVTVVPTLPPATAAPTTTLPLATATPTLGIQTYSPTIRTT